jgi:hypothetical protein
MSRQERRRMKNMDVNNETPKSEGMTFIAIGLAILGFIGNKGSKVTTLMLDITLHKDGTFDRHYGVLKSNPLDVANEWAIAVATHIVNGTLPAVYADMDWNFKTPLWWTSRWSSEVKTVKDAQQVLSATHSGDGDSAPGMKAAIRNYLVLMNAPSKAARKATKTAKQATGTKGTSAPVAFNMELFNTLLESGVEATEAARIAGGN